MWIFRELLRLLWMIAVATAVAAAVAGLWALLSGGDLVQHLRVGFLLVGCVLLLFAGAGNRRTASRRRSTGELPWIGRVLWIPMWGFAGGRWPDNSPRPDVPTLTATAVFFCSALVLIALGAVV